MGKWIIMACRNIFRNRRRSFVTLAAIAVGFAAITLFRGYTDNTYEGLRESAIRGEGLGHLSVFKKGWKEHGAMDPKAFLLSPDDVRTIMDVAGAEPRVILGTPELHISGLVSNGSLSTVFLAKGVVPGDEKIIQGAWASTRPVTGNLLSDDRPHGVEMAKDLAANLDLKPGSDAVILSNTLDGQMNALGVEVSGIYNTGTSATNDKYMRIPFAYAQELYDTDRADRVILLLDHWKSTGPVRERLEQALARSGLDVEIRTWTELSTFYNQVRGMFTMIFTFIFSIVLVIVVMSVINTMGMAVLERTREIGTLRALGLKRRGVSTVFALEGGLLGLVGCLAGLGVTVAVWGMILFAGPSYTPPGSSSSVALIVNLVPRDMAMLTLFLVGLSLMAAILPARRAARQSIVEALGHT
ncbi:MAG: FtsX-like permease family protein [Pseudomonadota bacterium]